MKSFLIVEDDETISKLNEILIKEKYGDVLVSFASNGKEALEKTSRLDYTAIITDLEMPIMNGLEFHMRLKECKPHLAKRTALISAYADTPKASYFQQEGCQTLTKPYDVKGFYSVIDSIINSEVEKFTQEHGHECMRKHARFHAREKCTIRPLCSELSASNLTTAETIDYSESGLGIKYEGKCMPLGFEVIVSAFSLDIIKKRGKIVWSKPFNGCFNLGLQWV